MQTLDYYHNLAQQVSVVIVTYGDRAPYVIKTVEKLLPMGISNIIIIGNNVMTHSASLLDNLSVKIKKIIFIKNPKNFGSAVGFGMGIDYALKNGCDFLWLLDDDSTPRPDTLNILLYHWQKLNHSMAPDRFALFCFRKEHHPDLLAGKSISNCYLKPGSFLGFHIFNIWDRIRNFIAWKAKPPNTIPEITEIPYASYGGFFAHSLVYKRIGFPKKEFFFYYDDNEYTYRLTRDGGKIFLCTNAQLDSLENSWFGNEARMRFGLEGWFKMVDDFRVYYGVRNLVYFEMQYYSKKISRFINRKIYLIILGLWSIFTKQRHRFKIITKAILDAENGRLGSCDAFPLP